MSTFEVFATLFHGDTFLIVPSQSTYSVRALSELRLDVIIPSTAVFNLLVQQEASPLLFHSLKRPEIIVHQSLFNYS